MSNPKPHLGILGLWHLGSVYSASFAKLGYKVTGYDPDRDVIRNLNKSIPPIFEPGLTEEIRNHLQKNLTFSHNPQDTIANKQYIFVALDSPVDENDEVDTSPIDKLFKLIVRFRSPKTTIVISSQVPIGTCRKYQTEIKTWQDTKIIYFPENIRLGEAFKTFLHPDRIILGSDDKAAIAQFKKDFPSFVCPILEMGLESAEMAKHTMNSFLAVNISFAGEISDLCELTGANYLDVVKALKTDSRVGENAPLKAGIGFAGGTIGRDVKILKKIAKTHRYSPKLLNACYQVNQERIDKLFSKIKTIYPKISGKRIGLLGLTYKPGTNTLRRSRSLELAKLLYAEKAEVKAHDPAITKTVSGFRFIKIANNLIDFFNDLDLAILLTPWPQFKDISNKDLNSMKQKVIIDTANLLDIGRIAAPQTKYYGTGVNYPIDAI